MHETAPLNEPLARAKQANAKANAKANEFIPLAQEIVDVAIDVSERVCKIWDGLRLCAQRGEIEAAQAVRGAFLVYLEQGINIVHDASRQAHAAEVLAGKPLPRADQLAGALSRLDGVRREALAAWQHPLPRPLAETSVPAVWMDDKADIYAGRSRASLGTIVEEYNAGATAESIAAAYDTLTLAEVYEVIAYYVRYRAVIDAYLKRREAEAEELRRQIEAAQPSRADVRAKITERWAQRKSAHASPAE